MGHLDDELLDRYADGALTGAERATADDHLATCARCRAELAAAQGVFATCRAVPVEPVPVDLAPRVLRRIAPAARRGRPWVIAGLLAAQAAITILLALRLMPSLAAAGWLVPAWPGLDWSPPARDWLPPRVAPLAALAPVQWGLIVAALAVLWLVGNRLVLASASGRRRGAGAG